MTILLLSIIVINLKESFKERKVRTRLSNRLEFDKVLLDTIPNAIYYKNIDGKFMGCNLAFANLICSTKDEVIGKTAFDFFSYEIASKNTFD